MTDPLNGACWLHTASGRVVYPLEARVEDIAIEDIAHALANQCRFSGHVRVFYSVAEHSVRVSRAVPREAALWGLLHDAAEAYLVDLPTPLKRASALGPIYEGIEARLMAAICARFGLPAEMPDSVKVADRILLRTEQRDLMPRAPAGDVRREKPLAEPIVPWSPESARYAFIERFVLLGGEER